MAVNLTGVANATCARHGTCRNLLTADASSTFHRVGRFCGEPTAPAYGASKAGLNAMSQIIVKLAPHNISGRRSRPALSN
ncbi:MAG: SDR family oxidoreductase [Anaerolineae bacterium]|nr:SDR family oxidoreductase [Anaerolineae bacterium]